MNPHPSTPPPPPPQQQQQQQVIIPIRNFSLKEFNLKKNGMDNR
jgi:hypothetical protein